MFYLAFYILFMFFCSNLFAARYYKFRYYIQKGDTFPRILKRFTHNKATVSANDSMIKLTIRENKLVKDWRHLGSTVGIDLYILMGKGYRKEILEYVRRNKARRKQELARKKKIKDEDYKYKKTLTTFGFYTISRGKFDEKLGANAEISSTQTSLVTLGAGLAYRITRNGSISSSFYYSKLEGNALATGETIDIPNELGITAYYQHHIPLIGFSLYGGFDYESFATFNLSDVFNNGATLAIKENKILWYTFGLAKFMQTPVGNFLFKGSYSTSLSENANTAIPYEGNKFILYLNWKPTGNKILYHVLYKQHDLVGETDLTVTRWGVGIGWSFF